MLDTRYSPYPTTVLVPLCPRPSAGTAADPERAREHVREQLAAEHGVQPFQVILTDSGTTALWLALTCEDGGDGNEVVLSSYNCPSILRAVWAAGCHPVLVDIDGGDLLPRPDRLVSAVGPLTRAVLATHLVGQTMDLRELSAACAERGVCLIDDAAQVYSGEFHARPLGSFGDYGLLSFGRHKPLLAGGGALIVQDIRKARKANKIANRLRQNMAGPAGPWYDDLLAASIKVAHTPLLPARMSDLDASRLRDALTTWPTTRKRGMAMADSLRAAIHGNPGAAMRVLPRNPTTPYTFLAVEITAGLRHRAAQTLALHGVETTRLYLPLSAVVRPGEPGDVPDPGARRRSDSLLCLPCRGDLTPDSTTALIKIVNNLVVEPLFDVVQRQPG